jgi:hypothetical protein
MSKNLPKERAGVARERFFRGFIEVANGLVRTAAGAAGARGLSQM